MTTNPTLLSSELFFNVESTFCTLFSLATATVGSSSTSMLHYAAPERIAALFPRDAPQHNANGLITEGGEHFPSATYL